MRRRDWFLIVAAAVVDAPRIVDSYMALHGGHVAWDAWPLVHGLSGLGMACIGAWAVAECLHALAVGRRGATWNLLAATVVAMLLALGLQVLPPIAGVQVEGLARVAWAVAAVASPLLVVAAMPVANALASAPRTHAQGHGGAFDVLSVVDSRLDALTAQIAQLQLAPVQAVQFNLQAPTASLQTPSLAELAGPLAAEPMHLQPAQPLQSDGAGRLAARLRELQLQGARLADAIPLLTAEGFSKSEIAQCLGKPLYQLAPSRLKADELVTIGEV